MPIYKMQRHAACSYSSLQRSSNSEMKEEPLTMDTSVFDFNEGDPKPFLQTKAEKASLFRMSFNHGRTPSGKQENRGKSLGANSKKKLKLTAKKLPRKKSRRNKTTVEVSRNRSSSASDLIEADDSDSESNQNMRTLDMRFGGAPGISCSNTCRNEDLTAEQSREVVMHGKQLVYSEQCFRSPEFIFTADGIVLKIGSACTGFAVKWALQEIESFKSCFDEEQGLAFIKLNLTEHGVRTFLQALEQSDGSCHTLISLLSSDKISWDEDVKKITSLSDGYKSIWKPLIQEDLENQHLLADCIACDRDRAPSDNWSDLIFPTKEDHDAVTVTQYDFLLLNPDQFLSDTIIDFYIKYLQSLLSEEQNKKFYFYNSFFFRKLTEVDKNLQQGFEKRKSSFERVKRWTAKINIFEKDYLFIPIMQSAHWSLVIICRPGSLSAACQDACDSKVPTILHFDSLEGCHTFVEEPIQRYVIEAWNEKNGPNEDPQSLSMLKFVAVKAPQQTNYSDCGLFLLHYVELFIKKVLKEDSIDFAFDEQWFNPAEASSKRAEIKSLIEQLKTKKSVEKLEESWLHTSSNVTGPPDEAWSAQRSGLLQEECLKTTNLFPGNVLDQGCSMLVSYPQQYQNNHVCAHTKFGPYHVESGLDLEQLLATRELQQCFCHGQSQAPNDKLCMHCLLQQGAVIPVQDIAMLNCTCVDKNCGVHDFNQTLLHASGEGTSCNENLEDFHALDRDVGINLASEFMKGSEIDASELDMVEENCIFMKSDSLENISADAQTSFGFSLHYDGERFFDMSTSTLQKNFLEERPCVHAFQKGNESPKDGEHCTNDDSLPEQVAKPNSEPNKGCLEDVEPKIWVSDSTGDGNDLEGKETNSIANKCAEDGSMQSEIEIYVSVATPKESLTERTKPLEVYDISSPLVEEGVRLDRPQSLSSDDGLTWNAAEGSKEGKKGRGRRRSNSHQVTPATRRITRSASKR